MNASSFSKSILIFAFVLATWGVNAAANRGVITGKIFDKLSNQPIPYVAVTLGLLPDSTIKMTAFTDDNGAYTFTEVADGKYVVSAFMVGYGRKHSNPVLCKQNAIKMDDIILENSIIREVTVTGRRPEIEVKADRMVMNVENSSTAAGENAYEVLRKAPGVNIDKDDNISLKGKDGVLVTINDKSTYLSGTELAGYLKSLNGTEIEKVELITAPPARYEAAGNVGIINIKLKKSSKVGINGSATAGLIISNKVGRNAGVNLNMRRGKLNTFASVNGYKGFYKSTSYVDKRMAGDTTQLLQNSNSNGNYSSLNVRLGADYDINRRHTVGVMARMTDSQDDDNQAAYTRLMLKSGAIAKSLSCLTYEDSHDKNYSLNLNYKFSIDTTGRILNVDADYVKYKNRGTQNNDTYYFKPDGSSLSFPLYIYNNTPSDIYIKSFRADYVHPFSKMTVLESGIKGSMVNSDNNLIYEKKFNGSSDYINDPERSNHFKYEESILAAYASLSYDKNGWQIKGGLRAEQTWGKGNQLNMNVVNKKNYIDIFPTFFIMRTLDEKNNVGIAYNRRIDRPSYGKLNPFISRLDEYTFKEGNPYLKPQYTNNVELNYSWANSVFSSLSYSYTNDVQMQVLEEVDNVKLPDGTPSKAVKASKVVERNIDNLRSIALNVSVNLSPVKWFRTNSNITAMHSEYRRDGGKSGNSRFMYMIFSSNSFILPKQYIFEIMGRYNSSRAYGLVDLKPQYLVNVGLQKKVMDGKITLKVSADDLFHTMSSRAYANYDGMDFYTKSTWGSQRFNFSVTYNFGSKDVKQARQRSTSSEEEQSRSGK